MTESRILKSPLWGGVFQSSALAVGNNGGGKISCCFFSDILKFCSPLAYIPIYYHGIGRQQWQRVTLRCVLERHFSSMMKQLSQTQWTDCLLMQPVSIEVQHHTCPSKIRWPRWCCPVISQVILCVFSRYYGRLSCSESRIAFFSCSSDVRVVLNCASLSRYSMKVAIFLYILIKINFIQVFVWNLPVALQSEI